MAALFKIVVKEPKRLQIFKTALNSALTDETPGFMLVPKSLPSFFYLSYYVLWRHCGSAVTNRSENDPAVALVTERSSGHQVCLQSFHLQPV